MPAKVILLVEDSADDEALMRRALKKHKVEGEMVVARDGAQAVEYLLGAAAQSNGRVATPTVVFLDLKLPKLGGLEVLERIRADERTRLIPVVILTSSSEEKDIAAGYRLGANSYVRKPVDLDAFVEVVRSIDSFWLAIVKLPPE